MTLEYTQRWIRLFSEDFYSELGRPDTDMEKQGNAFRGRMNDVKVYTSILYAQEGHWEILNC